MIAMNKKVSKIYTFESSSNPDRTYEGLLYEDGSTSCDCPGWTRRAERSCKHTRLIENGLADAHCLNVQDVGNVQTSKASAAKVKPVKPAPKQQTEEKVDGIARKIIW